MKLIMENWRGYLEEQGEDELRTVGDLRRAVSGAIKAKKTGAGKEAIKDVAVGIVFFNFFLALLFFYFGVLNRLYLFLVRFL